MRFLYKAQLHGPRGLPIQAQSEDEEESKEFHWPPLERISLLSIRALSI